jgi:hypothetical protein
VAGPAYRSVDRRVGSSGSGGQRRAGVVSASVRVVTFGDAQLPTDPDVKPSAWTIIAHPACLWR